MARTMDDALPFDLATPRMTLGDDEIAVHAEALDDGRDAPELRIWPPFEVQDDEIGRHLEAGEMLFEGLPARRTAHGRRATRH